ncbi:MAG: dTDP-4-dehydrorhamnose reductase [Armatimonadota bacterium]|nr:dTDP-4-dehydrorhamnose reductase [Armatimonadota bacterium]
MRILITGAAGMLGNDLQKVLGGENELILTDIVGDFIPLDITDTQNVRDLLFKVHPDLVIHSAAYTDVDGCEREPEKAYRINSFGTWNVATGCEAIKIPIIYISTDFVFDGEKGEPYYEFDTPNPLSHYGKSKYAGELYVSSLCSKYYIIRTAWLYGEKGKNFPRTMLTLAKTRKELTVVDDQIGSPTFTYDLALKIRDLIQSPLYGIYHVTNKGLCSWFEFAKTTLALAGITDVEVKPIKSSEWPSPTKRPKYSVLKHWALEMQGMDDLRHWEEALKDFIKRISNGL